MKHTLHVTLIVLFLTVLYGFSLLFLLTPDSNFSEEENRSLQTFPSFSLDALLDGSFSDKINTYFSDQFPMRNTLVGIKGFTETAFGKGENNGVLLGKNGQLAVRLFDMYKNRLDRTENMDFYYTSTVQDSINGINAFAQDCPLPLVTFLPPRTIDVTIENFDYPSDISDTLHTQLADGLSTDAHFLDLLPFYREKHTAGEYVYYRTDHHMTTYGAYLAYCEIMREFGLEDAIIPEASFSKETYTDFYGTTWSRAGFKWIEPDTLELWSLGNDENFTLTFYSARQSTDESGNIITVREPYQSFTTFYNREKLSEKDKYAVFLDGTHNELTVSLTDGTFGDREVLLIAKDSFANAIVPFLSQHFDIILINLAGNLTNLTEYINAYGADRVLLVYNWANLVENCNLAALQ